MGLIHRSGPGRTYRCANIRRSGGDRFFIGVDSFVADVHGDDRHGTGYGYTHERACHATVVTRAGDGDA